MKSFVNRLPILLALAACSGCRNETEVVTPPTAPEQRAKYANLEGLKRSQHPALKAEYERLTAERVTPLWLDQIRYSAVEEIKPTAGAPEKAPIDVVDPPMVHLSRTFSPFVRNALAEQLASVYPVGSFDWGPAELTKGREIRRRYEVARRKFREDLAAADSGLGLRISDGPLTDVGFLDAISIGCRLEGTLAADSLADGQLEDALDSIGVMLHAAALLSKEWHLASRIAAVAIRAEALHALAATLKDKHSTEATQRRAFEILSKETADWPPDELAWIGDRGTGLVTYELVRDGYFLSLLSREETEELTEKQILLVTGRAALRNVDADEAFFLSAMRRLIESCRAPYYLRQPTLQKLLAELDGLRDTPAYPIVAGRILLTDFEPAMRRQTEDLARCQAWLLALGLALGLEHAQAEINPLTGEPYVMEILPDAVRITKVLSPKDEPVVIPKRAPTRAAGTRAVIRD